MSDPSLHEASCLVGEDIAFQRRVWRFQRIGWCGMAVLLLLGAAGLFGGGPLARTSARSADGAIEVEWERIERIGRNSTLRVRGVVPRSGPLELRLEGGLAGDLEIPVQEPQPSREARSPGEVRMWFEPPPEGQRAEIRLSLRSSRPGFVTGRLSLGGSSVNLHLVVLP